MSAPLSNAQKRHLSILARRAFRRAAALARGRGEAFAESEEQFRHREVTTATGKIGLRCAGQDDYRAIEAHLWSLLKEEGRAFTAHVKAQTNSHRQAEAVLAREIEAAADVIPDALRYITSICRAQFRCSPLDASEKQLWNLVYTLRNRAASRRKKGKQAA